MISTWTSFTLPDHTARCQLEFGLESLM